MKIKYLFLLLLFPLLTFSQTIYYTTDHKDRLNEQELREHLEKYEKEVLPEGYYASAEVQNIKINGDSAIYHIATIISCEKYSVMIRNKPLLLFENKKFPDFHLKTLSGEDFGLKDILGKTTILYFWQIECAPSISPIRQLNYMGQQQGSTVNFVSIPGNTKEELEIFFKRWSFDNFTHLVDSKALRDKLGVTSYPVYVIINAEGTIIDVDFRPEDETTKEIKSDEDLREFLMNR